MVQKCVCFLKDMGNSYCAVTIAGLILTVIILFMTHGEYFSELFFYSTIDTGMDFFHSIEYTRGKSPYDLFDTLYPPLANLCFYVLYCLVPMSVSEKWADTFAGGIAARGTEIDLRVQQSTMILFIMFLLITSICLISLVRKILSEQKNGERIAVCMLMSYGVLWAYERGNIIIVSMICSMFFVFYKNSSNKIVSELALLALAFGSGLKLYPAIFGILLIYDKQYKKALRTVVYGIVMFVLPVFAFKEGVRGISKFMNILFIHTQGNQDNFFAKGLSADRIINTIVYYVDKMIHCGVNQELLQSISVPINIITVMMLLICGIFLQKRWEKVLVCTLAMILCQNQAFYILCFMLIPLLSMIKEEKKITIDNIVPFVALVLSVIMLPCDNPRYAVHTMMYGKIQGCTIVLMAYIVLMAGSNLKKEFIALTASKKLSVLSKKCR